jgi:hypothetical protein
MKGLKVGIVALTVLLISNASVWAQGEITDNDLRKYAVQSQVITYMKKDISIEINKMIKAQDGMTGQRYKELASAKGDEAKLAAVDAKDFEIQFMALTNKLKEDRKDAIKSVNTSLATKMVGDKGKVYKAIKAALKTDADLKARYDVILAEIAGTAASS